MSANRGVQIGPGALRFERLLPGPLERVWDYLVVPELRRTWLADGEFQLSVGGEVEFVWHNEELGAGSDPTPVRYRSLSGYRCTGVVTACEPPRPLAFTWDEPGSSSEVRIELSEAGTSAGQVRLVLTHRRLTSRGSLVGTATGWHTHLEFLRDQLEGARAHPVQDEGKPAASYWSLHERYEQLYHDAFSGDAPATPEGCGLLVALPGGGWRLEFERRFDASLERVWRAIAESEGLDGWYPAELRFEPWAGGSLTETFRAEDGTEDGVVNGRVTAYEPQRLFSFQIDGDPGSEHGMLHRPQSISIELRALEGAAPEATLMRFEHRFEDPALALSVAPGWHHCLEWLALTLGAPADTSSERAERDKQFYRHWLER